MSMRVFFAQLLGTVPELLSDLTRKTPEHRQGLAVLQAGLLPHDHSADTTPTHTRCAPEKLSDLKPAAAAAFCVNAGDLYMGWSEDRPSIADAALLCCRDPLLWPAVYDSVMRAVADDPSIAQVRHTADRGYIPLMD